MSDQGRLRPRVGISSCLLGEKVRYDGGDKRADGLLANLGPHVEWVPVCPEVELGLSIPREPIQLVPAADGGPPRLVACGSGLDLTQRMAAYAGARIAMLATLGLDGYVLKSRSPSCGRSGVPVVGTQGSAPGAFARVLLARMPGLEVQEETSLTDAASCAAFLAKLRSARERG